MMRVIKDFPLNMVDNVKSFNDRVKEISEGIDAIQIDVICREPSSNVDVEEGMKEVDSHSINGYIDRF